MNNYFVTTFPILEIYEILIQDERVLLKLQFTEKKKAILSIVTGFFSNVV